MFRKNKCHSCLVEHPILTVMTVGFAIIGVSGVVMAAKKKAGRVMEAAKQAGCACVENVKTAAENAMESGIDKMQEIAKKVSPSSSCDEGGCHI